MKCEINYKLFRLEDVKRINIPDDEFEPVVMEYGETLSRVFYDNILIGYIEYSYFSKSAYIHNYEVLKPYQNEGFGVAIIKLLFLQNSNIEYIEGMYLNSNRDFYLSKHIQADLCENCTIDATGECIKNYSDCGNRYLFRSFRLFRENIMHPKCV